MNAENFSPNVVEKKNMGSALSALLIKGNLAESLLSFLFRAVDAVSTADGNPTQLPLNARSTTGESF